MSIDLIDRVQYLKKRGDESPLNEVLSWILINHKEPANEFSNNGEKYFWKIISSKQFKEIIDEDMTDWFLIFSKKNNFKALAKVREYEKNFVGEKKLGLSTIWIFNSEIETLKVTSSPILIWTPYMFERPLKNINYDFIKLIDKLKNPKVRLEEFILDRKSKETSKRIR